MKVGTKLLLAFLAIGIVFAVIGLFFLFESRRALSNEVFQHLESVREIKKAQIEYFFAEHQDHLHTLLEIVATFKQNAAQKLKSVQEHQKAQLEWYFRERLNDIDTLSKSELLIQAMNQFHLVFKKTENVGWAVLKDKLDLELKRYKDAYGYNDLLLMTAKGEIVYTTTKSDELGQNLLSEALKYSPLAKGFKKALEGITLQDFEPYALMNSQPVAFITAPIFSSGEIIGVLAVGLSPDSINAIVQRREGKGKTEESYLVGAWNEQISYRSDRVLNGKEQYVVGYETSGDEIDKALAGQSGITVKVSDSGELELASYAPLQIQGLNWGIITTISLEESIAATMLWRKEQEDFSSRTFSSRYINQYGYHDLYLIHPDGKIFYTVKHEADYATNILTGKYANSTLGYLIQDILQNKTFSIGDYAPYAPSYNEPHLFVAQPVLDQQGEIELIVALQLSDDILDQVMLERAGLGKSGETYLVGSDKLMRSNSFLDLDNHSIKASFANPSLGAVDTQSSRAALAGEAGEQIIKNYLGHSVLSAYTPLKIGNTTWALIAEMNENEAFAALIKLEWLLGIVVLLVGFTAAILIHRFTKRLLTPLLQVNEHLKCLAQGKLVKAGDIICRGKDEMANLNCLAQGKLVGADDIIYRGKDEIAEIIGSFHQLRNSIKSTIEQANAIAAGDYTREVKLLSQQDQLGIALSEMTHTLYSQSQHLQKHQAELRRINDKLEQRVIQRTHQLAKANQKITGLNERLKAENLRMGAELEITRQLQQMVLPKEQELKQIKGLDIAGFMEPADEVGGDYYDVLQHNGRVKIGIGDVTGHGLASGVLMLMVQMAVRTLLANGMTQPETFLTILNRVIYDNVQRMNSDKNLTLSLLDYQEGVLRLCGQHEEVLVVRQGGYIERIDTFNLGFMVGIEPDITDFVAQKEITLQPGDGVVLYTDGITEARNLDKKQYGVERLCEIVGCYWHQSALEIQRAVIADVRQHIGQQKVYDDITLLVFKQKPAFCDKGDG